MLAAVQVWGTGSVYFFPLELGGTRRIIYFGIILLYSRNCLQTIHIVFNHRNITIVFEHFHRDTLALRVRKENRRLILEHSFQWTLELKVEQI